jgi:hypothetical protein
MHGPQRLLRMNYSVVFYADGWVPVMQCNGVGMGSWIEEMEGSFGGLNDRVTVVKSLRTVHVPRCVYFGNSHEV